MKASQLLVASAFAMIACQSPKEKSIDKITQLESQDSVFSPENIKKLEVAYQEFAEKYPDDELAPEYLFKAGQRCNVINEHQEALRLFQLLRQKYPKHKMAEEALFLQGYVYENSLHDLENAKKIYEEFINQYPKSELTEDAQLALVNLGKTPEEILESMK